MFYGLAEGRVDARGYEFEHILKDIETLNRWALEERLDVTAISVHGYSRVADRYAVLTHGASMGDGYGPLVVAREELTREQLRPRKIAIPGTLTSAFLALRLWLGEFEYEVCPFDQIMERVIDGQSAAGLLIHEGQLSYRDAGLRAVVDLGRWWKEETGMPLPLGINVVRKGLGPVRMAEVSAVLRDSIAYGLEHRVEALNHALRYARGLSAEMADRFVGMYVNDWTLDMGEVGQRSIRTLLERGAEAGVMGALPAIEFVS
jgi:1,4-dihydroxy-6-naphthoate synthase